MVLVYFIVFSESSELILRKMHFSTYYFYQFFYFECLKQLISTNVSFMAT